MWLWQYAACTLSIGVACGLAITAPRLGSQAAFILSVVIFAAVATFRMLLLANSLKNPSQQYASAEPKPIPPDEQLPSYSVLVPLFREAAIVPDLIEALSALEYPTAKLEIALVLEESDAATLTAIARSGLPPQICYIVVPDKAPRTKPKALNYALAHTHGDLVAVFDAEDVPASDQLRKAAAVFVAHPGRYACLQARLAIYNPCQSWISRHFALEYAALFHGVLPALTRLGVPLPLSGTSNHFRRDALEAVGAWDPFNVTEDADLGLRLARAGHRVALLDSATREEAPSRLGPWLAQRTRWIKGWMQTYLVHTRAPGRLRADLGAWPTLGVHATFAGFLVSALSLPWLIVATALELSQPAPFAARPGSLHHALLVAAVADLALGVGATLLAMALAARRAGLGRLAGHILAAPLYWVLISLAAYRALYQLIRCQHLWEKTPHAARGGRRRHGWRQRLAR